MPPPVSDPYNAGTAAAGGGTPTTSSTVDIWGLGDYGKERVVFGEAYTPQTGFGGYDKLPAEDQDRAAPPGGGAANAVTPTAAELMQYYAGLGYTGPKGKAELEKIQRLLYQAGYYGASKPSDVAWGSWSGSSKAFHDALIDIVQAQKGGKAPVSFEEFLGQAAVDRSKVKDTEAPTPHQLSNPRVIASVLQQTAQSVLGRNLTKDEVDHFVSDYTATEEEYFKAVDRSAAGGNPLSYQPPSVEAAAMDTLSETHGTEASGNRASDYMGIMQQLLSQGSIPVGSGPALPVPGA